VKREIRVQRHGFRGFRAKQLVRDYTDDNVIFAVKNAIKKFLKGLQVPTLLRSGLSKPANPAIPSASFEKSAKNVPRGRASQRALHGTLVNPQMNADQRGFVVSSSASIVGSVFVRLRHTAFSA